MIIEYLYYLWYTMMFGGLLAIPAILIMHLLLPKAALERYFRPPHFREAECTFFSDYPLAFMRTIMFMAAFAFPARGKKRKMTEAYLLAPKWYRVVSKWIFIIFIGNVVLLLILTLYLAYR